MSDYLHAKTENVQKFLDDRLKKQKQDLISEFLRDYKWYLAFDTHYVWISIGFKRSCCICKTNPFKFRDWMIKKWEDELK